MVRGLRLRRPAVVSCLQPDGAGRALRPHGRVPREMGAEEITRAHRRSRRGAGAIPRCGKEAPVVGAVIAPFRAMAEELDTMATLHERAQKRVGSHQRLMEKITAEVGRPRTIYVLLVSTIAWIATNLAM